MKTRHHKPKTRIDDKALELANAVDSALSVSGEINYHTTSHTLREIKALARSVLRNAKAVR